MNIRDWKRFKKHLMVISTFIGIFIPIICFFLIPQWDISIEPLSKFGISDETKYLWLAFNQIIALLLFVNNINAIDHMVGEINLFKLKVLKYINIISIFSLSLSGFINMNHTYTHLVFATMFFLFYTAFIFWWGVFNIRYHLKKAIFSIVIALIILSSTYTLQMGYGYGIFEAIFIVSIIIWNIKILGNNDYICKN